jgi:flagellar hook-length control protein FliK
MPQVPPSVTVASPPSPVDKVHPATPADQIAPALVGILQKNDGQQSVTIRLQPAELGQVQIRIDQTNAGAAHINIIAERPETLQLLQRDEPRLQQTLDQAGVLSSGRTVSFQVATPEQVGASASRPDSMETGSGTSGQGQSGGAWRQSGDSPNDFGRGSGTDQGQTRTRWFRAGLDITA